MNITDYLTKLIPDPKCELTYEKDYQLLIKVMLSARTTDKIVNKVGDILFNKYPTLLELKNAPITDIENIIKPVGTYHKKSLNIKEIASRLVIECNSSVPNNREYLESLPGVGRKTANVVLSNLFNENCIAVDTHVKRVSVRLKIADINDSPLEVEKKLYQFFSDEDFSKLHHRLVLFGRYYCKAINPKCHNCKLNDICNKKVL